MIKRGVPSALVFALTFSILVPIVKAQDPKTITDSEAQKQKLLEAKNLAMVDSLTASIGDLKLPENRIRTAASLGNTLWSVDPDRARTLFRQAQNTLITMESAITTEDSDWNETIQNLLNVRGEIVQMIAVNDPEFALEFLNATRIPASVAPQWAKTNEIDIELHIAGSVAYKNPATALAKAEESLSKGLSWNLPNVVTQLLHKDPDKAATLAEEIAERISSDDLLLQNAQASGILTSILTASAQGQINSQRPDNNPSVIIGSRLSTDTVTLPDATLIKMLNPLVATVLKVNLTGNDQSEKGVAFGILSWMISQDAFVQKYASSQYANLQKKIAQYQQISGSAAGPNLNQLMQNATPDAIVKAAANASAAERINFYYQASQKASAEGDNDQAVRIIEDNVKDPNARDQGFLNLSYNFVNNGKLDQAANIIDSKIEDLAARNNALAYINDRKFRDSVAQSRLDDALAMVSRLPQQQQIDKLMQLSSMMAQNGKKEEAFLYLDRAWNLLPQKAANFNQLQLQLNVAMALASVDTVRAGGYLQPVITRLNDLLRAAETLNGFDVNYFKDGELTMQGGSLQSMVRQCGSVLALIAQQDFDQAKQLSETFEKPEAKIMAQLTIVTQLTQTGQARTINRRADFIRVYSKD